MLPVCLLGFKWSRLHGWLTQANAFGYVNFGHLSFSTIISIAPNSIEFTLSKTKRNQSEAVGGRKRLLLEVLVRIKSLKGD
jgi:hypothetical protein